MVPGSLRHPAADLLASIPVDPDRETARRMVVEELGKPAYRQTKGLLQRLLEWVGERLSELGSLGGELSGTWIAIIVMAVVLVVAAIALVVAGPVRRRRAVRTTVGAVLGRDDARTAAQIRASAVAAAADGDLALATVERFRAIVRSLEERALLEEVPSRTAEEAAADAGVFFPTYAQSILPAARLFDAVLYGHRTVDEAGYASAATLDETLAQTRPVRAHDEPSAAVLAGASSGLDGTGVQR